MIVIVLTVVIVYFMAAVGVREVDLNIFNIDLPMIKWEDEQAWKISNLKN